MEWFTELPIAVRIFLWVAFMALISLISVLVRRTTGVNLEMGADFGNKSKKCSSCLSVIPADASRCKNCGEAQNLSLKTMSSSGNPAYAEPTEKTCPACISQVPFIASRCKFCGIDLVVEDLSEIRRALEEQEKKAIESENLRRTEADNAARIQQEQAAAKQKEKERIRIEHLDSLTPLKRFLTLRKVPIALVLIGIVICAIVIPGQISKARESSEKEQTRQQAMKSAAAADDTDRANAIATAENDIAEFETQYCALLNTASKDSGFKRYIGSDFYDLSEAEKDVVKEKYIVNLTEIYTKYTSLGVRLGADRGKYVSPILELHVTSYWGPGDTDEIIAKCSAY